MLSRFRPNEDLPADFMMIMYGMRRAGKTTMLLHMLEEMKDRFKHTKVFVFSGTACENPAQWKNFPPGVVNHDIENIDVSIGDILRKQRESIRAEVQNQVMRKQVTVGNKRKRTPPSMQEGAVQNDTTAYEQDSFNRVKSGNEYSELTDSEINEMRREGKVDESRFPRILIILDDVVNENKVRHSQNLNKLAVCGRHIFITCIILSQAVTGSASVPPIIRRNSDFIIVVGYPRSIHERKMLSDEYLTIGNESDSSVKALRLLKDTTQMQYRAFVISVINSTATEYNQFVFQYGPVPPPPRNVSPSFKLGTPEQWAFKLHHGNREPEFTKEDQPKRPTGRFSKHREVKPIYRSSKASASNPFAVDEYFIPNLF